MNDRRPRTFGLSVEGATAAANASGLGFEDSLAPFEDYLSQVFPHEYIFTKKLGELPDDFSRRLEQFFPLNSVQLRRTRPPQPIIGDIHLNEQGVVEIYTGEVWKRAKEGIAPDRVLYAPATGKAVLIEAKYGDTEGNAHIERAGARATPQFLDALKSTFGSRLRYLYIFSGPMVTARGEPNLGAKLAQRGSRKGEVVQSPDQRRFASARYLRQIEILFGSGREPIPWDTLLWDAQGMERLVSLFERQLVAWLNGPDSRA